LHFFLIVLLKTSGVLLEGLCWRFWTPLRRNAQKCNKNQNKSKWGSYFTNMTPKTTPLSSIFFLPPPVFL
jgi:hypothetical protein